MAVGGDPHVVVEGKVKRVALMKPDSNGVVSFPTSIAGFRGFDFDRLVIRRGSGEGGASDGSNSSDGPEILEQIAARERAPLGEKYAKEYKIPLRDLSLVYAWTISIEEPKDPGGP